MTIRIPDYLCLLSVFILVLLIYGNTDCAICPCLLPTGGEGSSTMGPGEGVGGDDLQKKLDSI